MLNIRELAETLLTGVEPCDADCIATATTALQAAAEAFPQLPALDVDFVRSVNTRCVQGLTVEAVRSLHLGDLLIAYQCTLGHPAAYSELQNRLQSLRGPLRQTGATPTQIDELLGDLPSELVGPRDTGAPRILGYSGRGPLQAWLRVVAVRGIVERRRKAGQNTDDTAIANAATPELSPELDLLRRQYADVFRAAFESAMKLLPTDDRTLLRQYHIDHLGHDALATLHGVHRVTIARRLSNVREQIFLSVRQHLQRQLAIGNQSVDSILRIVRNELDVSIERYL